MSIKQTSRNTKKKNVIYQCGDQRELKAEEKEFGEIGTYKVSDSKGVGWQAVQKESVQTGKRKDSRTKPAVIMYWAETEMPSKDRE